MGPKTETGTEAKKKGAKRAGAGAEDAAGTMPGVDLGRAPRKPSEKEVKAPAATRVPSVALDGQPPRTRPLSVLWSRRGRRRCEPEP